MNIEDLYYPGRIARLYIEAIGLEAPIVAQGGEREFVVSESLLVEMFKCMGAVSLVEFAKMNKNESGLVRAGMGGTMSPDNQHVDIVLPLPLLEIWREGEENIVRAIMSFKNQSLKDIAGRYGGKSAAANVANFLAKSDNELLVMRSATRQRLADALECPLAWIVQMLEEIEQDNV